MKWKERSSRRSRTGAQGGGEDEGGVDLGRVVSVGLLLLWWEIQGTYGSQTPVEDGDQALDWGLRLRREHF